VQSCARMLSTKTPSRKREQKLVSTKPEGEDPDDDISDDDDFSRGGFEEVLTIAEIEMDKFYF